MIILFLWDFKIFKNWIYIVGSTIHDELNIYNLAILEKYRNKGFATKLLCYAFEHLSRVINSVYVEVRETNF